MAVLWFGWLAAPSAEAAEAVLVGAGDIAECGSSGDSATARLVASIGGTVFTLGDNVYEDGTAREFRACFGPTWGRFRGRIRPAVGNHEYGSGWPKAYWDYFGSRAGPKGKGWYSYSAGAWRVIVLNSNCSRVGCRKGSEQERWLRAELARHANKCTLAYFHHPRFSSNNHHGNSWEVGPFWEALYAHGADLISRTTPTATSGSPPRRRGAGTIPRTESVRSSSAPVVPLSTAWARPTRTARYATPTPSGC